MGFHAPTTFFFWRHPAFPRCRRFCVFLSSLNNNLSNYDKNNVDSPTIADCNSPGVKEGTLNGNSKNTPNTEGLTAATEGHLSTIFPNRAGSWNAQMALYNGKNPCVFLRGADTEWAKWLALATKSDLNAVLMYRGVITGDLNRGRNLVIAPGIYSIQSVSTITNGPSDFGGWGIFVQFPDNLFSQMILNSPNYIKFRKYSGSDPSWGAW